MTMDEWLDANNRYLEASLEWLRFKILVACRDRGTARAEPAASRAATAATPARAWFFARRKSEEAAEPRLLPAADPAALDAEVRRAEAAMTAAGEASPPPALAMLAKTFGLSAFERSTLLLSAALELDPSLSELYALAQDGDRPFATLGLAMSLFDDPAWDAVSGHGPLRSAGLLEVARSVGTPTTVAPVRADERIVDFLKGLNVLDPRLSTWLRRLSQKGGVALSASQRAAVDETAKRLSRPAEDGQTPVVQMLGRDALTRRGFAAELAAISGCDLFEIATDAFQGPPDDVERLIRLCRRESVLLPIAFYVDADDVERRSADASSALRRFVAGGVGLVVLGVREPLDLAESSLHVDVAKPTADEQSEAWRIILEQIEPDTPMEGFDGRLVGQFDLDLAEIRNATLRAVTNDSDTRALRDRVWEECRAMTRPRLGSLAERIAVKATWDDLVLPDEQQSLLRQIVAHVRERHTVYDEWGFAGAMNRGFGVSALFAGESGTGKTMAAEVIANELRLDLHRIDLSSVVDKYIGETEKNLRRLFDAAERGGTILLFDEADALFGKRSEVRDSHDRYANIEINYLLQRIEAFRGLAILATNVKTALDPAFLRRLRFVVNFPYPGVRERAAIWKRAFPEAVPTSDVDFDRLARLNVSGGNIHNIALNAAFAAAADERTVTMSTLIASARAEMRKLDRPIGEAELRI